MMEGLSRYLKEKGKERRMTRITRFKLENEMKDTRREEKRCKDGGGNVGICAGELREKGEELE